MYKNTKIVILLLGALLIFSGLFAFKMAYDKQELTTKYTREVDELSQENKQLQQKALKTESDNKALQSKMDSINKDLNIVSSERESWKSKYDVIARDKENLLERVNQLQEQLTKQPQMPVVQLAAQPAAQSVTPTDEGYLAAIIKEKASLEVRATTLVEEIRSIKMEFDNAAKDKKGVELELSKLEQLRDDLQRQLEYNAKLANTLSSDLAREVSDKQFLLEQFNKTKQENSSLRTQVKELSTSKMSLEKKLTKLQDDKALLDKRLSETETILQDRIRDILKVKQDLEEVKLGNFSAADNDQAAVELPPIVVRAQQAAPMASGAGATRTGRIISINADNNFVIVDLGENDGIQIRDRFNVYRNNNQIATIEVIELRKDIAAADIVSKAAAIQVGDLIR